MEVIKLEELKKITEKGLFFGEYICLLSLLEKIKKYEISEEELERLEVKND